jgi:hypothetical protein
VRSRALLVERPTQSRRLRTILIDRASGIAAEPQEETLMKGAQKPKKGDKKPAQKTLKEKRQDKRNAAKGNSGLQ